ncbi:MAG TPA: hypothetical protein PLF26_00725 [Blastocatellia bacterium]|nr:hypothetical protein [Blastocatellia bacterium]
MDDASTKAAPSVSLDQAKIAVQEFQVRRLKRDFRDLRLSDEFGPFTEFFATEIYSARDFTERNESFRRVTGHFRGLLGEEIYTGLTRLLDLHSLTDKLDGDIAELLLEAGTPLKFSESEYEVAYRDLDNYDERLEQIEMIIESLQFTHHISQMSLIGVALKSARVAVGLFSKDKIVELLETAYSTLRGIKKLDYLCDEVRSREVARLDRIFGRS